MNKRVFDLLVLIFGAFIFAVSINIFVLPSELGEGGVTGLTIIFYYLFGWSPGLVNLIINSFLVLIGYKFLGRTTTIYTVIAVLFLSLFLHLTEGWYIDSNEIIVNAIFGGVLTGVGIGLIIRVGGTTAGSSILASITNKYFGWSISYGLLFFDFIVVLGSYFVIGIESVMLTIIMLYVGTKVMDFIIEGLNPKKAVMIISQESEDIAKHVSITIGRGITVFTGHGYYSNDLKDILYIIISKRQVTKLKKIVKEIDQDAFVTIHDVRDVFGEGFMDISKT